MSQLSALLSLLTDACESVEREYANTSKPLPSLDDVNPHPLDDQLYPLELRESVRIIEATTAQICASVGRPNHVMVNKCMTAFETACLQVAAKVKVADVLRDQPRGLPVTEIAEKCNVNAGKIGRVLRNLASRHCFREVAPNVFANNRLSLQLISDKPMYSAVELLTDENSHSVMSLAEAMTDPRWVHSYAPNQSAFNKWTGYPHTIFDWFENAPDGRHRFARFGASMQGWSQATDALSVVNFFPWAFLPDGAVINDLGGGTGTVLLELAKKYPHLQLILQDLPDQIEIARAELWPKEYPKALEDGRIDFKPINFLKESPVAGCDIYYLKNVLHDWPEKEAVQILRLIAQVMKPNSRVLIHEYIIQPVCRLSDSLYPQAPEPLLPNYGLGNIRPYNQDVNMLSCFNAGERELSQFISLADKAGLTFTKLWDLLEGGIIEFRVV